MNEGTSEEATTKKEGCWIGRMTKRRVFPGVGCTKGEGEKKKQNTVPNWASKKETLRGQRKKRLVAGKAGGEPAPAQGRLLHQGDEKH